MSEYQYYEFLTVDRPLTTKEMAELRSFSTRARITPTTFVNEYSWGNFKGDEQAWMERYFDAFLYVANWGTRILTLALPQRLLDKKMAGPYCAGDSMSARSGGGKTILSLSVEDDDDDEWMEPQGWLSSFASVRAELARGDLRSLYLGWLLCVQRGEVDEDQAEPPVPHGLRRLGAPLNGLVEFFRIDKDLVAAAAGGSQPAASTEPTRKQMNRWIASLPGDDKDDILTRLMAGEAAIGDELVRRMRRDEDGGEGTDERRSNRRTAGELLRDAQVRAAEQRRAQAEAAARVKARREREVAAARATYLDSIAGKEAALWTRVDELIATRQPRAYDEATKLLVDLHELSRRGDGTEFRRRLEALRAEHARKPLLIGRLDRRSL
ncbi:MAG: hypothetical protein DLM67_21125 [Candidatus Nephthysia bennettiae]|nr:MAG: hypothetical protein DLM67_21125 [Candidatus Dormibacteraeota bacterium]